MNKRTTWQSFIIVGFLLTLVVLASCHDNTGNLSLNNVSVMTDEKQCYSSITNKENGEPLRIVGLGDSLTVGTGDEKNEGGYIGKLKKKLSNQDCSIQLVNHSVAGNKTTDLLQDLQENEIAKSIEEAHVIMFTIGANDLVALARKERMQFTDEILHKAERQYAKHIEKILTKIKELNESAHIYIIGFYNPISSAIINNEQIDLLVTKWNNMSKHHTNELEHTYFVRIDDLFAKDMKRYLADDHFHPNHVGYDEIAKRLNKIIQAGSK